MYLYRAHSTMPGYRSKLPHGLSRDNSERTATEAQEQQSGGPKIEPASARSERTDEREQGHGLGIRTVNARWVVESRTGALFRCPLKDLAGGILARERAANRLIGK
jgi:hypothetical protein